MNEASPLLQLNGVGVHYGANAALLGVQASVPSGAVLGLIGPNGSGKSTTIKMILGLLRATSGRIALFNKPPTDVEVKRRIGILHRGRLVELGTLDELRSRHEAKGQRLEDIFLGMVEEPAAAV